MRRPGGAVWPAMKPTTGFLKFALIHAAASCSALPPISPIITTASVCGSSAKSDSASMKLRADQRVAADADARGLPQPVPGELVDGLVGQRAALRHDADPAFLADVAGDDTGLACPAVDQARAVRADQPRVLPPRGTPNARSMSSDRDAFGDADRQRQPGVGRFHDRVGAAGRRHEDHRRVGAGLSHASATVLNTGQPSCVCRPCRG